MFLRRIFVFILFLPFLALLGCGETGQTHDDYTLTTTVNPAGSGLIYLTPGGGSYAPGTKVTLELKPETDWVFSHWEGDVSGTANPLILTMDSSKTVTAVFEKKKYNLTLNTNGNGHITETLKGAWDAGATVSLTAVPDSGWRFDHWEGDLSGTMNPQDLLMNSPKNVTAAFVLRSTAPAKWNFLVYLDGDNNLEMQGIIDFNEMEKVGSTDDVNILVLLDRSPGYDYSNGDWRGARLYRVSKDEDNTKINSQLLADYGPLNMSNPDTLKNFIVYCQLNYPALHTALTLWDHGAGVWPRSIRAGNIGTRGLCWDDSQGGYPWNCLTLDKVATALTGARNVTGQKIDVLNTDSCLMQMLEVAWQWREQADYLVGSEYSVPGDGNDYLNLLTHLTASPRMPARDLAVKMVDDYYNYYNFGLDTTYSAIDLNEMQHFIPTFQSLAVSLKNTASANMSLISNVKNDYTNFGATTNGNTFYAEYIDLGDFCSKLQINVKSDSGLTTAAQTVEEALSTLVVHHHETGGFAGTKTCHGIAINLPWKTEVWSLYSGTDQYLTLDLSQNSVWDEFIVKNVAWGDANP